MSQIQPLREQVIAFNNAVQQGQRDRLLEYFSAETSNKLTAQFLDVLEKDPNLTLDEFQAIMSERFKPSLGLRLTDDISRWVGTALAVAATALFIRYGAQEIFAQPDLAERVSTLPAWLSTSGAMFGFAVNSITNPIARGIEKQRWDKELEVGLWKGFVQKEPPPTNGVPLGALAA